MGSKQLFRFIADVATLAARHFEESQQTAADEPEPPGGGQADAESAEEVIGSFASEFASVLDEDEGERATAHEGTIADAPTCSLCGAATDDFRQFARGRACYTCLWSSAPETARSDVYDRLSTRVGQIESLTDYLDASLARRSCGSSRGDRHTDAHPTSRRGQALRCQGKGIVPEGQQAGDLLFALDPGPVLAASLDQFPSAAVAFAALRSLCPAARAHLANLVSWARHSADQQDICEVLWALAVAHERGVREPIRGFASQLVSELVKYGYLCPSKSARSRRSHVFAWLGGKSSLLTRERPPRSPSFVWTVHLERLGDEGHWSRAKPEVAVTH